MDGSDIFSVFVGAAGTDISTFTPYNVYGNSVSINNLNPDTEYELIVVANCAGTPTSPWASNHLSDPSF